MKKLESLQSILEKEKEKKEELRKYSNEFNLDEFINQAQALHEHTMNNGVIKF